MTVSVRRCLVSPWIAAVALACPTGPGALAGTCTGESALAVIPAGLTLTLNPGGGVNDPLDEALVVFTNGPDSEPATVEVCLLASNPNAGALGYIAYEYLLTLEVSFAQNDPDNVDTFQARVMMPYVEADVPMEKGLLGPEATELTYFNTAAWSLAVVGNDGLSPGFAETVGDRTTVVGTRQPGSFSDELGDYGVFWHTDELRGFVWANVDQTYDFTPGAPVCWSDLTGDGSVDTADLLEFFGAGWGACIDPLVGCVGDIFVDGVIDMRDLAQLVAFWGPDGCFLPPDAGTIRHSAEPVDNSAGDAEWGAGAGGTTHVTWDLKVEMDPDDIDNWWTTTESIAELVDPVYDSLSFYQHPMDSFWNLGAAPHSTWCNFPGFEAAPFDSYYIEATDTDPCASGLAIPGAFATAGFTETPTLLHASWFNQQTFAPPVEFSPPFTIARYTILVDVDDPDCPDCHLDLQIVPAGSSPDPVVGSIGVTTTHRFGLSNLIPFSFEIIDFCAADVTNNGTVSTADLLDLLSDWGTDGFGKPTDIDRNGIVSTSDLLGLLSRWGACDG